MQSFNYRVATLPIGSTATFGIVRQGQRLELPVAVIAPPETMPRDESLISGRNPLSGAKLANLSPAVAEELGLLGLESGVVVTDVKAQSTADGVGLRPGDLIVALNGKDVSLVRDVEAAVKVPASAWRLTIQRGDRRITMMFRGQ
jgi:serine protease Do